MTEQTKRAARKPPLRYGARLRHRNLEYDGRRRRPALLRSAREAQNVWSRRLAFARKVHGFDSLASPRNPRARRAKASEILLRLAEMRVELARAFDKQPHIVHELADLDLDLMRLVAHARVAQDRLGDADRHHHEGRRDDDDASAMGLLHQFVELIDEIRID